MWGWLKPIAKIGAGIAAPFTGGASLAAIPAIDALGQGAGAASQAAASNRGTKASLLMDQNEDLERQLLAREADKRAAQRQAYAAAMMGERGQSWTPLARPAGVPGSYNGLTDASKGVSSELFNQAMARMRAPDMKAQSGMPAYRNLVQDKEFKKTLKPGFWEKLGGITSAAAPFVGSAISGMKGNKGGIYDPEGGVF